MPDYRLCLLDEAGSPERTVEFAPATDDEATLLSADAVNGSAAQLWRANKLIKRFQPKRCVRIAAAKSVKRSSISRQCIRSIATYATSRALVSKTNSHSGSSVPRRCHESHPVPANCYEVPFGRFNRKRTKSAIPTPFARRRDGGCGHSEWPDDRRQAKFLVRSRRDRLTRS